MSDHWTTSCHRVASSSLVDERINRRSGPAAHGDTRHHLRRTATTALAACVAVARAVAGIGSAAASPATSDARSATSRHLYFAGTTFASESNENVDVGGNLHVVTKLTGSESAGWTLDWHTNLNHTAAIGQTTGDEYTATGTESGTVVLPPGPPVRSAVFEPSFTLLPPGPPVHPPSPIRLLVNLLFDETGRVTDIEVQIDDGSFGSVD